MVKSLLSGIPHTYIIFTIREIVRSEEIYTYTYACNSMFTKQFTKKHQAVFGVVLISNNYTANRRCTTQYVNGTEKNVLCMILQIDLAIYYI